MPHEYSAENHDWDLTLRAAYDLLTYGARLDQLPVEGTLSRGFSCFTGSMLLSFCSIESFSASFAFGMPQTDKFKGFDFQAYKKETRFWGRLELIFSALGEEIDKSQGMFQKITEMQNWRNLVTHASPYRIVAVEIADTTGESRKLHEPFHHKEYARSANLDTAKSYYETAVQYIDQLIAKSGIKPRAVAIYKIGESQL